MSLELEASKEIVRDLHDRLVDVESQLASTDADKDRLKLELLEAKRETDLQVH